MNTATEETGSLGTRTVVEWLSRLGSLVTAYPAGAGHKRVQRLACDETGFRVAFAKRGLRADEFRLVRVERGAVVRVTNSA